MSKDTLYFEELAQDECGCFTAPTRAFFNKVSTVDTKCISKRGGHSVVLLPTAYSPDSVSNQFLLFGGSNRLAQFYGDTVLVTIKRKPDNSVSVSYKTLKSGKNAPSPRASHSAVIYNDKMYVYGGQCLYMDGPEPSMTLFDEVWALDLNSVQQKQSLKWNKLSTTLPKRGSHSSSVIDGCMYVFGGSSDTGPHNDMICLNLTSLECNTIEVSGEIPHARELHGSVIVGSSIVIAGGRGIDRIYDTFYEFNIHSKIWKLLGLCPSLCAQSLFCYQNKNVSHLGMFGGTDGKGFVNKVYTYCTDIIDNIVDMKYRDKKTERTTEQPKERICTTCSGPYGWVITQIGGGKSTTSTTNQNKNNTTSSSSSETTVGEKVNINISELSLESNSTTVSTGKDVPVRRFVHSCTSTYKSNGYFLFGGINEEEDFDDGFIMTFK